MNDAPDEIGQLILEHIANQAQIPRRMLQVGAVNLTFADEDSWRMHMEDMHSLVRESNKRVIANIFRQKMLSNRKKRRYGSSLIRGSRNAL